MLVTVTHVIIIIIISTIIYIIVIIFKVLRKIINTDQDEMKEGFLEENKHKNKLVEVIPGNKNNNVYLIKHPY